MGTSLVDAFLAALPSQDARSGFAHIIERIAALANQAQKAAAAAEQRIAHAEQRAAAAQQTLNTMSDIHQQSFEQLQLAVESAIDNAASHSSPTTARNNALRVVMARYDSDTAHGSSASNWISICEDHLRAYSRDASVCVVIALPLFNKSAHLVQGLQKSAPERFSQLEDLPERLHRAFPVCHPHSRSSVAGVEAASPHAASCRTLPGLVDDPVLHRQLFVVVNEPAPTDLDYMNNAEPSSMSITNSSSCGPRCFNCVSKASTAVVDLLVVVVGITRVSQAAD
ncbi:hypothetical protein HDZ31DRAFT_78063, partial [Schizophyllum fasciatum]